MNKDGNMNKASPGTTKLDDITEELAKKSAKSLLNMFEFNSSLPESDKLTWKKKFDININGTVKDKRNKTQEIEINIKKSKLEKQMKDDKASNSDTEKKKLTPNQEQTPETDGKDELIKTNNTTKVE